MNERRLKLLTRDLIDACGGLAEAAKDCRYDVPRLSRCQTIGQPDFLAIDVVARLELLAGRPIISKALAEEHGDVAASANLMTEGCEALENVAHLTSRIRLATADGKVTPRESDEIIKGANQGIEQLRDVITAATTANA